MIAMSKSKLLAFAAALLVVCGPSARATITIVSTGSTAGNQYSLSGTAYVQNFDTLSNGSGGYANGGSKAWTDDSTLPNWFAGASGAVLNTSLVLSTGAANPTNRLMSLGADRSSDRALGANANSSAVTTFLGVAFQNSSGSTLDSFTIGYTGEQWRENTNTRTQTMVIEYMIGATASDLTSASGWSLVTGSTFASSPTLPVSSGSLLFSSTIAPITVTGLSILDGQSVWFRWKQTLDGINNSEDIIGIDDVSVSFTAAPASPVPEPATYAVLLGSAAVAIVGFQRWRRRR
jgi:hypothetical protein